MKESFSNHLFKKELWISIVLFLTVMPNLLSLQAQNRKIEFETKPWKQNLKKAQKVDKLIFLDCYTQWCGFCKALDKYIFTMDNIADFYNANYVNVHMDMEKGIGPELCKKYGVRAFPTLLIVDSKGNLIDSHVGFISAQELIDFGTRAKSSKTNYAGMKERYDNGERDITFLKDFINVLKGSTQSALCNEIIKNDIETLPDKQFYTTSTWKLLKENSGYIMNLMQTRIVDNRQRFDAIAGAQQVDSLIDVTFLGYVKNIQSAASSGRMNIEKAQMTRDFIYNHKLEHGCEYLAYIATARLMNQKDYKQAVEKVKEVMQYNMFRPSTFWEYLNWTFRDLARISDMEVRKEAAALIDQIPISWIEKGRKGVFDATKSMLLTEKKKN